MRVFDLTYISIDTYVDAFGGCVCAVVDDPLRKKYFVHFSEFQQTISAAVSWPSHPPRQHAHLPFQPCKSDGITPYRHLDIVVQQLAVAAAATRRTRDETTKFKNNYTFWKYTRTCITKRTQKKSDREHSNASTPRCSSCSTPTLTPTPTPSCCSIRFCFTLAMRI